MLHAVDSGEEVKCNLINDVKNVNIQLFQQHTTWKSRMKSNGRKKYWESIDNDPSKQKRWDLLLIIADLTHNNWIGSHAPHSSELIN